MTDKYLLKNENKGEVGSVRNKFECYNLIIILFIFKTVLKITFEESKSLNPRDLYPN